MAQGEKGRSGEASIESASSEIEEASQMKTELTETEAPVPSESPSESKADAADSVATPLLTSLASFFKSSGSEKENPRRQEAAIQPTQIHVPGEKEEPVAVQEPKAEPKAVVQVEASPMEEVEPMKVDEPEVEAGVIPPASVPSFKRSSFEPTDTPTLVQTLPWTRRQNLADHLERHSIAPRGPVLKAMETAGGDERAAGPSAPSAEKMVRWLEGDRKETLPRRPAREEPLKVRGNTPLHLGVD